MWKRILFLPTWATVLVIVAVVIIIAVIFSSINPYNPLNYFGKPTTKIDISQPAVVRQIQGLQRLETASYTIDKIIQAGTDGNAFQDLLYGDRILLVAHGSVIAGTDLSRISLKDVEVKNRELFITLPATEIFSTTLDEQQTKVFDRQLGLLSKGDKDLESQARSAASQTIRQAACADSILQRAADEAKVRLQQMYTLLEFKKVVISIEAGNC